MKEEIIRLLKLTGRAGIDKLIEWMEQNGFFTSPCSGGHHLAKEEGLAEHSHNVYSVMCDFANTVRQDIAIPFDSIIIVSLLHDIGKCSQFGKPGYIPNMVKDGRPTVKEPEQKLKQSDSKPFMGNPELLSVPHEVRSIQIASRFIELTEEENFAILYHNGMYGSLKYKLQGHETPLYLLLHMSDMWASRVVEIDKEDEDASQEG
ncbi:MAG TPA: HD family phosphohydrolase [Mobilitalea sp.]|nr:HD family phosphohydrolase [Mobilitalea sp.]